MPSPSAYFWQNVRTCFTATALPLCSGGTAPAYPSQREQHVRWEDLMTPVCESVSAWAKQAVSAGSSDWASNANKGQMMPVFIYHFIFYLIKFYFCHMAQLCFYQITLDLMTYWNFGDEWLAHLQGDRSEWRRSNMNMGCSFTFHACSRLIKSEVKTSFRGHLEAVRFVTEELRGVIHRKMSQGTWVTYLWRCTQDNGL